LRSLSQLLYLTSYSAVFLSALFRSVFQIPASFGEAAAEASCRWPSPEAVSPSLGRVPFADDFVLYYTLFHRLVHTISEKVFRNFRAAPPDAAVLFTVPEI